jgi:hypothetical protein
MWSCRQYTPAVWRPKAAASTQTEQADVAAAAEMLEGLQLKGDQQEAQAAWGASPDANRQYSSNPFAVSGMGLKWTAVCRASALVCLPAV